MKKQRIKILAFTFNLCFLFVISRFFYWQIIKNQELKNQLFSQTYRLEKITQQKGNIYSSDSHPLLTYQPAYLLSLYKPNFKADSPINIASISAIKNDLYQSDLSRLNNFQKNSQQKWISLETPFTEQDSTNLSSPGFIFTKTSIPLYPEKYLAQNIIDNLATYYSRQLQGRSGYSRQAKDATNQTILSKKIWRLPAVDGLNLHTSIHRVLQYQTENILRQGVEKFSADSGEIIIMEPKTGAILAMANHTSASATSSAKTNPSISSLFEPGSIFKPLVVAIGLESQSISPDFVCTQCHLPITIDNHTISNWDNSVHPNSNLQEIIKNSDNIGMSYLIQKIEQNNFLEFFKKLGLSQKTGIDLPGEARPLAKNFWPKIDFITASFGQGFAITQIQMIQAFNSLANSGNLSSPKIASYFTNNQNEILTAKPNKNQKVFSQKTTNQIIDILRYATENGAVSQFKPKDLEVCGKSGTAQVAIKGGYSDLTDASYIGFSPCHNPKFTIIVTIHHPRTSPWGSSTAAPIWFELANIASNLL